MRIRWKILMNCHCPDFCNPCLFTLFTVTYLPSFIELSYIVCKIPTLMLCGKTYNCFQFLQIIGAGVDTFIHMALEKDINHFHFVLLQCFLWLRSSLKNQRSVVMWSRHGCGLILHTYNIFRLNQGGLIPKHRFLKFV